MKRSIPPRGPLIEVRHSRVHGHGVFALRHIRTGTTILEYLGDRVSHAEADARYADKRPDDNHTFLFTVDDKTVIDAGVNGNEARYVNHGCDPNCQSVTRSKRIFIEAIRTIRPGEELHYDYQIQRDADDADDVDEVFACRCGAEHCRGSMLEPVKKPRRRRKPARSKLARGKPARSKAARGKPARSKPARSRPKKAVRKRRGR